MTDFFKMDIFFVTTTVAVTVLTVLLVVVLIRVLRILKNVEDISEKVEEEADLLREDIAKVRNGVIGKGALFSHLLGLIGFGTKKRSSRKSKSKST